MKIIKFSKLKDNRYTVYFDNDLNIKLYDDVIVKYNLLSNKILDDKQFEEITKYNDRLTAYYKALKYLNKKLRTEKEIKKYLEKEFDKIIIDETVDKLKKDGYLNKDIYLKCYVNDQVNLANVGPNKIKDNLVKLGFNEDEVKEYVKTIDDQIWLDKLQKIVTKKINTNRQYGNKKLKEKLVYEMGTLGYYKWMIDEVILSSEFKNNEHILEKEFNKNYNKLSRKFSGEALIYQLRSKLMLKGFSFEEIENFIQNKKNF